MTRPSIIVQADRIVPRREVLLVLSLIVLIWAIQLRYPPLSYPHIGLMLLAVISMLSVMLPVRLLRSMHGAPAPKLHPAALPALFFVIWALVRWFYARLPFTGASDIGTILWCACYGILGYAITRSAASTNDDSPTVSVPRTFLAALSVAGFLAGLHSLWQYFVSYAEAHQQLLDAIGNRRPDRTEMGLLYHLQLRRVASVFGDPNTLATFSAMALAASLEMVTPAGSRTKKPLRVLGALAIPACLAAIFLSGSRGGVLDCLLVLFSFAGYFIIYRTYRAKGKPAQGNAILFIALIAVLLTHRPAIVAQPEQPSAEQIGAPVSNGWFSRSSTITERIHYLNVGTKMIKLAPIAGLGPGSVERYFGRLKSPEARESKYLHNWIVQIWAELGLVALIFIAWFLVSMSVAVYRKKLWLRPADRTLLLIFLLLLFDGLIQVTWNQRELMSTFGLITGILMARTVRTDELSHERFNKAARLAVCVAFVTTFALLEGRFLAAKAAKYRAIDAMTAGDLSLAIQEWSAANQWTPSDPEPLAARASIASSALQYTAARQFLDRALTQNPDSASLHAETAKVAQQLRQTATARTHLEKALALYPSHAEYNYLMANLLYEQGHRQQALKFAKSALKYNYMQEERPKYEALVNELESLTAP